MEVSEMNLEVWQLVLVVVVVICEVILKGMALWRSAQNGHKGWFVVMLILNTAGILPLVYLLITQPKNAPKAQ